MLRDCHPPARLLHRHWRGCTLSWSHSSRGALGRHMRRTAIVVGVELRYDVVAVACSRDVGQMRHDVVIALHVGYIIPIQTIETRWPPDVVFPEELGQLSRDPCPCGDADLIPLLLKKALKCA